MVYCGKASLGCQNCRTRRIKCDKVKPECTQCIRVGKTCPGYRDQLSLMFRDESSKVIQKAHAQWGVGPESSSSAASAAAAASNAGEGSSSSSQPEQPETAASSSNFSGFASFSSFSVPSYSSSSSSSGGTPSPSTGSASLASGRSGETSRVGFSGKGPAHSQTLVRSRRRRFGSGGGRVIGSTGVFNTGSSSSSSGGSSSSGSVGYGSPGRSPSPNPLVRVDPTWQDKGINFFLKHYVLGLPDEPPDETALSNTDWVYLGNMQHTMAAVGLAGLANLRTSAEIGGVAQQMYGLALQDVGKALQTARTAPIDHTIRNVLMLAMFEIVRGTDANMGSGARTHIVGAAAILRSFFPIRGTAAMGLRGLLQLCYSLLLSCIVANIDLPPAFADWVNLACKTMPEQERASTALLPEVMKLVTLATGLRTRVLVDGSAPAAAALKQLLEIDATMAVWEAGVEGKWVYRVGRGDFHPQACFRGWYHVYTDNWTARIWNHYRWARLLTSSLLLEFSRRYPRTVESVAVSGGAEAVVVAADVKPVLSTSSSSPTTTTDILATTQNPPPPTRPVVAVVDEALAQATITRMAEDLLISVPTHWKHPSLTTPQRELLRCVGGAGTGASGIPGLLFHVDVAASATGVPAEFTEWGLGVLDSVWADTGMLQARSLAERLRHRRDLVERRGRGFGTAGAGGGGGTSTGGGGGGRGGLGGTTAGSTGVVDAIEVKAPARTRLKVEELDDDGDEKMGRATSGSRVYGGFVVNEA